MIWQLIKCKFILYLSQNMFLYEKDNNSREIVTNTFLEELNFNKEHIKKDNFLPSFDLRPSKDILSNTFDI